jgi:2-polyprenyl-6-methoxyphenol hydroxylase-like FAD-dependent oxidoreductase
MLSYSETRLIVWFRTSLFIQSEDQADDNSFYGQGLNCGLEDVRVFNAYLERHQIYATTTTALGENDLELEAALAEYSTERKADLEAICELALNN